MEDLCHKQAVMTRQITFKTTLLISFFLLCQQSFNAANKSGGDIKINYMQVLASISTHTPDIPPIDLTNPGNKVNPPKHHLSRIDELGKIHRFRKERVKKAKQHGEKYWLLIKMVLVACHIALLIHAFMHLTH
jgi:hypothetical protein